MSATSKTGRATLVAANGRARRPAEPPQGDLSHAETQRGGERRDLWFGEVPDGWEVKRLVSYFSERKVKVSDKDFPPLSVTKNGILPQLENVAKTDDGDNRKLVRKGDFVINSRSDRKGSSGLSEYDGSVSLINLVLKPRGGLFGAYCNYLLKSLSFVEENYRNGRGIVADLWTTRYDEMKMIKVAMPPLPEQKAIVAYLDAETGRIDKAIAAEEKMIALLQERREIVINEAVGECCQCENVANAQSQYPIGTGNIGTGNTSTMATFACLPKGWGVKKVKQCAIIEHGSDPKTEGDIPVYGSGAESFKTCGEFKEGPTVLLGRKGATLHIPHYVEGRFWNVDTAFNVYAKPNLNLRYFYYCATCFDYKRYMSQTTLPSMTQRDYANMPIHLPPLPEQEAIVERLDRETGKIDRAIEVKRRQIELLRERRQIVIDEVVTGKVKVA